LERNASISASTDDPNVADLVADNSPWLTHGGKLHCCCLMPSSFLCNSFIAASSCKTRMKKKRGKSQLNKHNNRSEGKKSK
jgi:hypothetical protein